MSAPCLSPVLHRNVTALTPRGWEIYDSPSMGSRWKIEFDAIDPGNPEGKAWKVGIAPAQLDVLQTNSHTVKLMRIMLVEEVLNGPCAIFGGWCRPDKDDCFVYLDTNEIVGCRIKGISGILEDLPNYLHVDHQGARLSMIFWSFRGGLEDDQTRETFKQLAEAAGDMPLRTA